MSKTLGLIFVLVGVATAGKVSPVQKVVELLDECKGKVLSDLDAEAATMEEYTAFCDTELKEKGYAIETATREIGTYEAAIADAEATIAESADEIATLGSTLAAKDKELYEATSARKAKNADFQEAEKELLKSVDEAARAVTALSKGMALMQTPNQRGAAKRQLKAVREAITSVMEAVSIDTESHRRLKAFLQQTTASDQTDSDDLSLKASMAQPQAKMVAYESKSGGILQTVKDMQSKAEGELSDLRKKEMGEAHNFKMLEQGLNNEISHSQEKLSTAKSTKAGAEEALGTAQGDLAETEKNKAADEEYSTTLKTECEETAREWADRQASAKEEVAAIEKAKDILVSGVTAFSQVKSSTVRASSMARDDDDSADKDEVRAKLSQTFQNLGRKYHSFALMEMATAASSDPFVKIRGLIEDMIAKLMQEAQEEATQKAFCDEEMGKSTASIEEKTAKIAKYQSRLDTASATIGELTEAVKTLESEIGEIDTSMAEATKIRTTENVDNTKAIKEFSESADAVTRAMGVLKSYYEGALIQTNAQTKSKQPSFGSAKSDTGSSIISVLEVAESDFTRLLAETETAEDAGAAAFKKLSDENKVSRAAKVADVKAKQSEMKSLEVTVSNSKEDHASVSAELAAVNSYVDKLKPQCEEKVMSYAEKKAAREAEIEGLKEALEILDGSSMLQTSKNFLR